jgi:thiamine-phosphate pyrophosphorylase
MKGYYFITDSALSKKGNMSDIKAACEAGVKMIQFRSKNLSAKDFFREALSLKELCKASTFIINDRLDIALAINADGIHMGQDDLPLPVVRKLLGKGKIIGITVHSVAQARQAQEQGADYLAVSPVFATLTKGDAGNPCGMGLIIEVRKRCHLPIAAIGGITLENAREVVQAGADMICAISAVVSSDDVKKQIQKFQEIYYDPVRAG